MKIKTIETKRLYLRGFEKEDARFAISIWNDSEMGEYLRDPSLEEIDEAYLKEIEELGSCENCCYMIAESKEAHERIGTCSFIPEKDGKSYDIAYCVHKKYWRNGYASEMVAGMMEHARQQGAEKMTIRITKGNIASNKIAEKFGFHIVGESFYKKRGTELTFEDYLYELTL